LGERLLCKQEVDGSIPFTSTTPSAAGDRLSAAGGRPQGGGHRGRAASDREKPGFAGRVAGSVFDRVKRE
jgi:hypothetical protein